MYGSSEAGAILGKATVRILGGGLSFFCFLAGHMANLLEVLLLELFPAECSLPSCGETYMCVQASYLEGMAVPDSSSRETGGSSCTTTVGVSHR